MSKEKEAKITEKNGSCYEAQSLDDGGDVALYAYFPHNPEGARRFSIRIPSVHLLDLLRQVEILPQCPAPFDVREMPDEEV
jgi:hypothetical protein